MDFLLYIHKGHKCNLDFYIFHLCKSCLSPICFGRAIIASTLFTNFYFYDFVITISHLFLERNTTMRVRTTIFTLVHFTLPTTAQTSEPPNRLDIFSRKVLSDQQTSYPTKIFCQIELLHFPILIVPYFPFDNII